MKRMAMIRCEQKRKNTNEIEELRVKIQKPLNEMMLIINNRTHTNEMKRH